MYEAPHTGGPRGYMGAARSYSPALPPHPPPLPYMGSARSYEGSHSPPPSSCESCPRPTSSSTAAAAWPPAMPPRWFIGYLTPRIQRGVIAVHPLCCNLWRAFSSSDSEAYTGEHPRVGLALWIRGAKYAAAVTVTATATAPVREGAETKHVVTATAAAAVIEIAWQSQWLS
jgi:hypothetical protein